MLDGMRYGRHGAPDAPGALALRASRRRRLTAAGALGALLFNTACYSYARVDRAPEPGQSVAILVNDAGRAALGTQLGAGIDRVDGRLVSADGDGYVVAVSRVHYVRAPAATWSGEQVRLRAADVARVDRRTLSKGRTIAAVGGVVAAVVVFAVTRGLDGFGREADSPRPPDPGPDQSRGRP